MVFPVLVFLCDLAFARLGTAGNAAASGGAMVGGGGGSGGGGTTGGVAIGVATGGAASGHSGTTASLGTGRPDARIVRLRNVARVELGPRITTRPACSTAGLGRPEHLSASRHERPGSGRRRAEENGGIEGPLSDGVAYDIGYDTVPFVRESITDVVKTMFEAVALVGLVVLVFLQDWKAMILPMIDVPVSIIGTFAVMAAVGFSLNNISLFGLVVTIGIVVDDAIVVLENIERMLARATTFARPPSRPWKR